MNVASLPEIGGTRLIEADEIAVFRRDGHVKIPHALDAEIVAAYRPHIVEAVYAGRAPNTGVNLNLWTRSEVLRPFVLSTRLARIAADLLGVDAVRLLRDEPFFKTPGGIGTPWHQDAPFLPLDTKNIVTLWIPLMKLRAEHAPVHYVTGSHHGGPQGFSMPTEEAMAEFEARILADGFSIDCYGTFEVGDVAAHHGWTLHGAPTNRSTERREALIIIYFADGARIVDVPGESGVPTLAELLPGAKPGDLAASELTPLVYDRRITP
jgi:hypothetical protein